MRDAGWIALTIVGWASWAIVQKLAVRSMPPLMVQLAATYAYSAIAPAIFLVMKARGEVFVWNARGILWSSLGPAIALVAGFSYLTAIEHRPVHQVMSLTSTYPILSFAMCWLLLGEQFTLQKGLGALLLVSGAVIMNR